MSVNGNRYILENYYRQFGALTRMVATILSGHEKAGITGPISYQMMFKVSVFAISCF